MAAPAIFIYSFLYLYPALSNLLYSTQRWDGVTKPEFVGLKNFVHLLTDDDLFMKVLGNNIRFSLLVVIFQTGTFFVRIFNIFKGFYIWIGFCIEFVIKVVVPEEC